MRLDNYERAKRDLDGHDRVPATLFRHLLAINSSGINGTSLSGNGTNDTAAEAAEAPVPLFPPDIFTPEQLKQVSLSIVGAEFVKL
jgi:hypothetical protein